MSWSPSGYVLTAPFVVRRVQPGDLLLQAVGTTDVVVVEHREVFALRHVHQAVARLGDAKVAIVARVHNPGVVVAAHHLLAVVLGAVVQQQQLKVAESLVQDALDGLPQEALVRPVDRHKH